MTDYEYAEWYVRVIGLYPQKRYTNDWAVPYAARLRSVWAYQWFAAMCAAGPQRAVYRLQCDHDRCPLCRDDKRCCFCDATPPPEHYDRG